MSQRKRVSDVWRSRVILTLFAVVAMVLLAGCGGRSAHDTHKTAPRRKPDPRDPTLVGGHWKMVLNLTFRGPSLNTKIWRPGWFGLGVTGPINKHELACYDAHNVTFPGGGVVSLNVTHVPSRCQGTTQPYTGALLSTNPSDGRMHGGFQYTYGILKARIYVPGKGGQIANWPTLMTLGQHWPQDGEDDIVEALEGTVCFHWHSEGYAPGGPLGACDPAFSPGWHTVEANWQPGAITWYYDGVEVGHETRGVTSHPMYIVLVNTVSVKAPTVVRANVGLKIKYIRLWQPTGNQARRDGYSYSF